MHGARNSPWNKILFALPSKNSERERERERAKKDWWNPIYKPMLRIPPLLDVTLSICASLFFSSLCLCCVCTCSLFVSFFYFLFFIFACSSPIYRGTKKQFFPILALNSSVQGAVWVSFSSIIPNFMVSLAPLFPLFK